MTLTDKEKIEKALKTIDELLVVRLTKTKDGGFVESITSDVAEHLEKIKTNQQELNCYWYHNTGFSCVCVRW